MKLNIKLFNAHTVIAPITFKIFICLPKPPRYKMLIIKMTPVNGFTQANRKQNNINTAKK